jgi:hypothetical protein
MLILNGLMNVKVLPLGAVADFETKNRNLED